MTLSIDRSRRPNPGEPQKWNAYLGVELIVRRKADPEHSACRALLERGITGHITFIHANSGMAGLTMDIESGAKFSTVEDDSGIRTIPYVPFPLHGLHKEPDERGVWYETGVSKSSDAASET